MLPPDQFVQVMGLFLRAVGKRRRWPKLIDDLGG